jgi:Ca2+-binding EF-hand superfamily protein
MFKIRDKSGSISISELIEAFRALGIEATDNEIELTIKKRDLDGNI